MENENLISSTSSEDGQEENKEILESSEHFANKLVEHKTKKGLKVNICKQIQLSINLKFQDKKARNHFEGFTISSWLQSQRICEAKSADKNGGVEGDVKRRNAAEKKRGRRNSGVETVECL